MGAAVAGDFPAHPHMAVSVLDRAPEGGREFRDGQFRNVDARFVHAGKVSAIGRAQSSWMFGGISTCRFSCAKVAQPPRPACGGAVPCYITGRPFSLWCS